MGLGSVRLVNFELGSEELVRLGWAALGWGTLGSRTLRRGTLVFQRSGSNVGLGIAGLRTLAWGSIGLGNIELGIVRDQEQP